MNIYKAHNKKTLYWLFYTVMKEESVKNIIVNSQLFCNTVTFCYSCPVLHAGPGLWNTVNTVLENITSVPSLLRP